MIRQLAAHDLRLRVLVRGSERALSLAACCLTVKQEHPQGHGPAVNRQGQPKFSVFHMQYSLLYSSRPGSPGTRYLDQAPGTSYEIHQSQRADVSGQLFGVGPVHFRGAQSNS